MRPEDVPIDEDTPLRPTSPYGVSKVAQDYLGLQYWLSNRVEAIRVRPFNHIGPRQRQGFVAPDFASQIAAIEEEPLLSSVSETIRMVYGKLSCSGSTAESARSARAPCPISLRPGPRRGLTSPTEKGGKL